MTNEEAIKRLKSDIYKYSDFTENPNENEFWTAFDMAIKALEQEPKTDIWSIKDVANTFKKHGLIREQEPCEDAISRQAVLDYIDKMPSELTADGRRMIRRRTLEEYISDTLPPVTPQQKTGHWIDMGDFEKCSVCNGTHLKEFQNFYGKGIWVKTNYCPNCGARMAESEVLDADSD